MAGKLVVAVLGHRNSGKTTTWNTLFGHTVRIGNRLRQLPLRGSEGVDVFLVSGSPEERHLYVGEIIGQQAPRIVLCSIQYREDVTETVDYFARNGYSMFVQWLNPGHSDPECYADSIDLGSYLLDRRATLSARNGKVDPRARVRELRDFIFGWASSRDLLKPTEQIAPNLEAPNPVSALLE